MVSVTPEEITKVLSTLSVGGPIELSAAAVARTLGPPVSESIVRSLMQRRSGLLSHHPEAVASLIIDAKRLSAGDLKMQLQRSNEGVF